MESSAGGTLLYSSNQLSYKTRVDLYIYKSKELDSIFFGVLENKENKESK